MFYFSVFVIFASLPCGYFSGKIQNLPLSYGDARLGDVDTLCDWFCSDDYDYGSEDSSFELWPGPGGRASPRIFCDLCDDKKDTDPSTSTVKTDVSSSSPLQSSTTEKVEEKPADSPQQPPQTPVQPPQTPVQPPQTPQETPSQPPETPSQPPQTPVQPSQTPAQTPAQPPQTPVQPPQTPIQPPQTPIQPPQRPAQPPQTPSLPSLPLQPPPQTPLQPPPQTPVVP